MLEVLVCAVPLALGEYSEHKTDLTVESRELPSDPHDNILLPLLVVVQLLGCPDSVEQRVLLYLLQVHDCDSHLDLAHYRVRGSPYIEFVVDCAGRGQASQWHESPSNQVVLFLPLAYLCADNWCIVIEEDNLQFFAFEVVHGLRIVQHLVRMGIIKSWVSCGAVMGVSIFESVELVEEKGCNI